MASEASCPSDGLLLTHEHDWKHMRKDEVCGAAESRNNVYKLGSCGIRDRNQDISEKWPRMEDRDIRASYQPVTCSVTGNVQSQNRR